MKESRDSFVTQGTNTKKDKNYDIDAMSLPGHKLSNSNAANSNDQSTADIDTSSVASAPYVAQLTGTAVIPATNNTLQKKDKKDIGEKEEKSESTSYSYSLTPPPYNNQGSSNTAQLSAASMTANNAPIQLKKDVKAGDNAPPEFDWMNFGLNITRTVMEIGKITGPLPVGPIPLGPACGLVANGINFYQDYVSSSNLDDNGLIVLTSLRNGTNVITGLTGDLSYCATILQDIAAGSVVAAPLVAITAPINEGLDIVSAIGNWFKVGFDSATATYAELRAQDIEILDPKKAEAYRSMSTGYIANTIADSISLYFDLVDVLSAGALQGEVVDKVKQVGVGATQFGGALKGFASYWGKNPALATAVAKNMGLKSALLKLNDIAIGVWGGDIAGAMKSDDDKSNKNTPTKKDEPVMRSVNETAQLFGKEDAQNFLGDVMLQRIGLIESAYNFGSDGINALPQKLKELSAIAEEKIKDVTDSKDPFKDMINMATSAMLDMENQMTALTQSRSTLDALRQGMDTTYDYLLSLEEKISGIQIPEFDIFKDKDIGDNPVADLLEGAVNAGQDKAEAVVNELLKKVQIQIDKIKIVIQDVVASLSEKLDFVYRWVEMLIESIDGQIIFIRDLITKTREELAGCENFEEIFNMMLKNASEAMGLEKSMTVQDIADKWKEFDAFIKAGINLAQKWVETNVGSTDAQRSVKDGKKESEGSSNSAVIGGAFRENLESTLGKSVKEFDITTNSTSADQLGAKAYNQGNSLVFGPGQFNTSTREGRRLIAHEMAHSVHNNNLTATKSVNGVGIDDDPSKEKEADDIADKVIAKE